MQKTKKGKKKRVWIVYDLGGVELCAPSGVGFRTKKEAQKWLAEYKRGMTIEKEYIDKEVYRKAKGVGR